MLQVTFNYSGEQLIFETLRTLQFKYVDGNYELNDQTNRYTATIENDSSNQKLLLFFSQELSFDQYKCLHKLINSIATKFDAEVDDHLALMGYLEDGSKAYIYHGWKEWQFFLEKAKHVSMEGQKVQVYNEQLLVGEGILVDTITDEVCTEEFRVIQCTIVSKSGENTIMGENLKIIPTGEF